MFKIIVTEPALEYIIDRNKLTNKETVEKLVLAIFYYSSRSWTSIFCGNVVELVEKHKVLDESIKFIPWNDDNKYNDVEIYIEESIIPELTNEALITIDVAIGLIKGEKFGLLFIKKDPNVYG